jgi:AraC-like DNA-binding protein
VVIGRGWNALTPVPARGSIAGLFVSDAALSGAPLDESAQVELAVLATILGNLIDLKRKDIRSLPWSPTLAHTPAAGRKDVRAFTEDVRRAMRTVCEQPTIPTAALAKAAHVTPRALARHFREQLGVALVDYRNRIRVERFLGLVEQGGDNLLAAALEAGFGSYAQFHRVFRHLVGVTPREYVVGRER